MVRAVSGIVRAQGPRVAAAALVLALCASCTSSPPPPKPAPPDPADETVAALTQALKLDAAQQKRTRELLKELADRDDVIRAGWLNRKRVKPKEIAASRGQLERDFFAILTPEQRLTLTQNRALLILRGRMAPH